MVQVSSTVSHPHSIVVQHAPAQPREEHKDFNPSGSLIMQLQKEPQRSNEASSRTGQIMIKIPGSSQVSVSRSIANEQRQIGLQQVSSQSMRVGPSGPHSVVHIQPQMIAHSQQYPYASQGHFGNHPQQQQQQMMRVSPQGRPVGHSPVPRNYWLMISWLYFIMFTHSFLYLSKWKMYNSIMPLLVF